MKHRVESQLKHIPDSNLTNIRDNQKLNMTQSILGLTNGSQIETIQD